MSKKVAKPKEVEIEYGIKSIKEVSYSISDSVSVTEKELELSIATKVEFVVKTNEIIITPLIKYIDLKSKKEILKIEVSNIFGVKNMKKFERKNKSEKATFDFPDDFINSLVGLSISHSRAFLSKNASMTKLEKFILPLIPPSDLSVIKKK